MSFFCRSSFSHFRWFRETWDVMLRESSGLISTPEESLFMNRKLFGCGATMALLRSRAQRPTETDTICATGGQCCTSNMSPSVAVRIPPSRLASTTALCSGHDLWRRGLLDIACVKGSLREARTDQRHLRSPGQPTFRAIPDSEYESRNLTGQDAKCSGWSEEISRCIRGCHD